MRMSAKPFQDKFPTMARATASTRKSMLKMHIRFFNTYEPVTTFYRDLLPVLARQGAQVEIYISAAEYRTGRSSLAKALNHHNLRIKYLPSLGISPVGRLRKTWLMLIYIFFAAPLSLFSPS